MKRPTIKTTLFAGIALMAITASPVAYANEGHHTDEAASTEVSSMTADASSAAANGNMPPMESMMSPDMMQMMESMMTPEMLRKMHQMMSQGGMRGMGTGSQGMAGQGMNMGQSMMPMDGSAGGMSRGNPSAMMQTLGVIYGMSGKEQKEMTPETVRSWLETRLEWHGNPRLKIGEIGAATDGVITAEIVTIDGSVVQKLAFNRYPGLVRQVNE